jgi:UDP-glucuronate 4-epimerase
MNILVTGAAGFIGSHLCEKLLQQKEVSITGIDNFSGPTSISLKQANLVNLLQHPRFKFINESLLTVNLENLLTNVDVIYHLAAIPGVRSSWEDNFQTYAINNIVATQKLLEACKNKPIQKLVFASTSSVYGEKSGKVDEQDSLLPLSPYGVSKLTGEHLCRIYSKYSGIPIVILRFFTVYGPRQRPDMAFHRFIKQILLGDPITIFGNGTQTRDFTYIDDCVKGTESVLYHDHTIGETINIGGKERASILETIQILEEISGKKAKLEFSRQVSGEPTHTHADISKAMKLLNYNPSTPLKEGLYQQFHYFHKIYRSDRP